MKASIGSIVEVQASGGVRTKEDAEKYIQPGDAELVQATGRDNYPHPPDCWTWY